MILLNTLNFFGEFENIEWRITNIYNNEKNNPNNALFFKSKSNYFAFNMNKTAVMGCG
jgi:hypothetical protein